MIAILLLAWQLHYNTPTKPFEISPPLSQSHTGLRFRFSTDYNLRQNYLCAPYKADLSHRSAIKLRLMERTVSGTPVFHWKSASNKCVNGCAPPSVTPMLWTDNLDLSKTDNRWWSMYGWPLAPGSTEPVVSLDPSQWTGVVGQKAQAGFDKNTLQICLTFGGGWFKGHGLYTTGGIAAFELQGATILDNIP